MNKNQKGFTTLLLLLIVVVIGAVGVAGWMVLKNKGQDKAKPPVSDTWLEYKTKNNELSFNYPSNWQVFPIDGSTGVHLDEIAAATLGYMIQEPETSMFMDINVINKPFSEVVADRDRVYAKPEYYTNVQIDNPSTKKTEFQFQGHKAIRFETEGITAFPPDDAPEEVKKANSKKPVYQTEIYIDATGKTFSVIYGSNNGTLEAMSPFNAIYQSLKVL